MIKFAAANRDEYWVMVLVRVPSNRLGAVLQALDALAIPQQYGGGWYIKRIEVIAPRNVKADPYSLNIDVKAGTEATLNAGLAQIASAIATASQNQGTSDTYNVTELHYSANW